MRFVRFTSTRTPPVSFPPKLTFSSLKRTTFFPVQSSVSSDPRAFSMSARLVLLRTSGLYSSSRRTHFCSGSDFGADVALLDARDGCEDALAGVLFS
jgi:hypothetical protein